MVTINVLIVAVVVTSNVRALISVAVNIPIVAVPAVMLVAVILLAKAVKLMIDNSQTFDGETLRGAIFALEGFDGASGFVKIYEVLLIIVYYYLLLLLFIIIIIYYYYLLLLFIVYYYYRVWPTMVTMLEVNFNNIQLYYYYYYYYYYVIIR